MTEAKLQGLKKVIKFTLTFVFFPLLLHSSGSKLKTSETAWHTDRCASLLVHNTPEHGLVYVCHV